jgi:hypothetical protein
MSSKGPISIISLRNYSDIYGQTKAGPSTASNFLFVLDGLAQLCDAKLQPFHFY